MFHHNLVTVTVLTTFSPAVSAAGQVNLETIHVQGQRSYNVIATEKNGDYSSFAATVSTKIPASLYEIPQSISIVTNQQVRDRNIDTFDRLVRKTPGPRVLSSDDGRSSVYARGHEYSGYSIDSLPAQMQSVNGTLPNLFTFGRVEVMRGPNGLFDSSGEMSGIVNLVRKRPTKKFQGHAAAGFGTHRQYKAGADVSGRLDADGSARSRVMMQTSGASSRPAEKGNHHEAFYAATDWNINPDTALGIGYLYQQRHLAPYNGLPVNHDNPLMRLPGHTFVGADWNKFKMNNHDVFADLKHYFGNSGYGKVDVRYSNRDADSNYIFAGNKRAENGSATVTGLGTDIRQKTFAFDVSYSQPFRLGNTANEFVIGADYNHFKSTTEQGRSVLTRGVTLGDFRSVPYVGLLQQACTSTRGCNYSVSKENLDEFGLYGKAVFRPVDGLSLIADGRIGHYKIEIGDDTGLSKADKTKFIGHAGTVHDLNNANSPYASFSQLCTPRTSLDTDGKLLKARQGNQFEAGYKDSYMNRRLNTRVSFYRVRSKSTTVSIIGDSTHYAAPGERVMEDVETEISGTITPKQQTHAGYSYLYNQIKASSTNRGDGISLLMPKRSTNLWTTYQITPKLILGGSVNAISHIASSARLRAGGYATLDAMAAYQFTPKLKLRVNADNIFNHHYYTRVDSASAFNISGAERSLIASMQYDFQTVKKAV